MYRQSFMKNWLSAEKCKCSFITFGLYTRKCWTLGVKVRHACQRCITFYLYGDHFEKKDKTLAKTKFFCQFWTESGKEFKFPWQFFALVLKLHSESVELLFDFLSTNNFVYTFWDLSKYLLEFCSEIFGNFLFLKDNFVEKPS